MGVATGNGEGEMRYHVREPEPAVEVIETNEAGLVFRVIESGRLYGISVDRRLGDEAVNLTELEPLQNDQAS